MTLRNQKSVVWAPSGLSDALDSSEEEFPGSLALCADLIPAQNNRKMMVARPAATFLASLPDFGGGPVTCLVAVGNMIYGMYASAQFSGKDRPFAYNLATGVFSTISGMTNSNLPASQPTTGDWTPPTAENVATRILFTHPGFPDGPSVGAQYATFFGNITNGSPTVTGAPFVQGGASPGPAVGSILFGTGIPPNTAVVSVTSVLINTTATGTSGTNTCTVASAAGIFIGQALVAPGGQFIIVSNVVGTTVTLTANLGVNLSASPVNFIGATMVMSNNASATTNGLQINALSPMPAKFGWLDTSNFTLNTLGDLISGLPIIAGNPTIAGLQPGMTITGANIPANTTITGFTAVVISAGNCVTASASASVTVPLEFPALANTITPGMQCAGPGIPANTSVIGAVYSSTNITVTLNQNATASATVTLTFTGAIIGLSAAATAGGAAVAIAIAGGTVANPLWGAGDTNINPLAAIPVFVRQLAGSAAFGVNTTSPPTSATAFSDPGIPCQMSQVSQIITFQNAVPVTAAKGLPLENQLGGIIQSLIVFQGASNIQQITGSVALGNITVNTSQVATGTFSPNSVASTPKGLIFASPFGLRMIDFDGRVTDPIGARGKGAVIPFQNAVNPTRVSASFNENTYRVTISWQPPPTLQNIWGSAVRTDEFWLHLDVGLFTGPHTSVMDLSAPWISNETFVCAPSWGRGELFVSDPDQAQNSVYIENGRPLTWALRTTLLPDDESLYANSIVESDIFASMSAATQWIASFIDDQNQTLAQAYVWLGPGVTQAKLPIYWNNAIVFRQGSVLITGNSEAQTLIGALGLRYQKLKYPITFRPAPEFVLGQTPLGTPGVLGP